MSIEYPAMIYKNGRSNVFVASCIMKNLIGFGKTEEDALKNLRASFNSSSTKEEIILTPMYAFSMTQNG